MMKPRRPAIADGPTSDMSDEEFLGASLLAPPTPPVISEQRKPRPSKQTNPTLYDNILTTAGLLLALGIAALLWFWGAGFTLSALELLGAPIARLGLFAWLLPVCVTAAEIKLWPKVRNPHRITVWMVILGLDIGTSWAGLAAWAKGRTLPIFDLTLPAGGPELTVLCLIVAGALAFWPEKLGRWSVSEIRATWRI